MQFGPLKRREVITLLGGAAVSLPSVALSQQETRPVIGFLHSSSPETNVKFVAAFLKGLNENGYVEGQNVAIEFRWAAGQVNRLPELAADLVRRRVAVITTPASTPATLAAKAVTTTIPIVFATGADPIALGLVTSLNRPGGNLTGISLQAVELVAKRLGLLRELAPQAKRFVALVNPNTAFTDGVVRDLQESAENLRLSVEILHAATISEIEGVFANLGQNPGSALFVGPDPFFTSRRVQLVTLATRLALPTIYTHRDFVEIGGLASYGPDFVGVYQQTAMYTGRILKGEKPADLPVVQPTKFELAINLMTAKAFGIAVPNTLLALADEVIE
jgi:ABC-type uncharacterized transport system substrate-binding protein